MFADYESCYSSLEKTCRALVLETQRLRHYMLYYMTLLISPMDPLKYLFKKPTLSRRLARWHLLLAEFYISYAEINERAGHC